MVIKDDVVWVGVELVVFFFVVLCVGCGELGVLLCG